MTERKVLFTDRTPNWVPFEGELKFGRCSKSGIPEKNRDYPANRMNSESTHQPVFKLTKVSKRDTFVWTRDEKLNKIKKSISNDKKFKSYVLGKAISNKAFVKKSGQKEITIKIS